MDEIFECIFEVIAHIFGLKGLLVIALLIITGVGIYIFVNSKSENAKKSSSNVELSSTVLI